MYSVFQHKVTGRRIAYSGSYLTNQQRAIIRRRRRISAAVQYITFLSFLTLTYKPEALPESSSHISKMFQRIRAYFRKYQIPSFEYIWTIDYGTQTGRPHFHALTTIDYYNSIIHDKLPDWWSNGFTKIKAVQDVHHVGKYVSKYMCKYDPQGNIRHYGASKGIPKTPKSDWLFISYISKDQLVDIIDNHNSMLRNQTIEAYI